MSDKPISDLRRRILQDMTNRNFGAKTQHDYIRHIETFAKFLGRAPDTASGDDIRCFQAEQIAQGARPAKMNTQASALRFFLGITCGRADLTHQIARAHPGRGRACRRRRIDVRCCKSSSAPPWPPWRRRRRRPEDGRCSGNREHRLVGGSLYFITDTMAVFA